MLADGWPLAAHEPGRLRNCAVIARMALDGGIVASSTTQANRLARRRMTDSPQSDPILHRIHASGLIALTIAAAAMLALSLFLTSRSATPTVLWIELRTVPAGTLSDSYITLLPPPPGSEAAAVPQSDAAQTALDQDRGTAVREIVLARVIDLGRVPVMDQLLWVVSTDAPGLPPLGGGGGESVTDFNLSFIDARSGEWISGFSQSHMVESQTGVPAVVPTSSP